MLELSHSFHNTGRVGAQPIVLPVRKAFHGARKQQTPAIVWFLASLVLGTSFHHQSNRRALATFSTILQKHRMQGNAIQLHGVYFDTAQTDDDLRQILWLQQLNLPQNLSAQEANSQGFVTIQHDLPTLQAMNQPYPHIVARDSNDRIVGYALVMLPDHHRELVAFLRPILEMIDAMTLDGKLVKTLPYCVMGQICIAKEYRGQGVFAGLYQEMSRHMYQAGYGYIITGVAKTNTRSQRAHKKVGFIPLLSHQESNDNEKDEEEYDNTVLRLRPNNMDWLQLRNDHGGIGGVRGK